MKYKYWMFKMLALGNETKAELVRAGITARQLYEMSEEELSGLELLLPEKRAALMAQREAWDLEEEYRKFAASGQGFVTMEDPEYPVNLYTTYGPPYALHFIGNLPAADEKIIAIVGARNCSEYGKKMALELGEALAVHGYTVISGMARGIDAYSHQGALKGGGKTIAVLGCGADVIYPRSNTNLYYQIKESGCIISEYPPHAGALAQQFPARNRIISGMANQVIVVEAREKSGSLITMDFALEQGKDIYAIPGRTTDPLSAGCNRIIAQGAGIITSVEQFINNIEEIHSTSLAESVAGDGNIFRLEKEEMVVYSCFDFYPKSLELVLRETNMSLLTLLSNVMNLCDKGFLREVFKNEYVKVR